MIRRILLPPAADGGKQGLDDFLAAGHTLDDLYALTGAGPQRPEGAGSERGDGGGRSQATQLVGLAQDLILFHDEAQVPYAILPIDGHEETHPLATKAVRHFLARRFYEAFGRTPGTQAMQDALGVLAGKAMFAGGERLVFVRLAGYGDRFYLDLTDAEWRVAEIGADGWRVIAAAGCPVRFRRAKGMRPLPVPEHGGSLDLLRRYVNVRDDKHWTLLIGYLVNALRPRGPYWVLAVTGEQGSAKSTLLRLLRALIDPNIAPIRSLSRDERDLVIAASNGWLPCFDNASGIPVWLSDALCRLATGGGFATRTLYENDEETIFAAMRPVAINGIEDVVTRGDLADRAIAIALSPIPEEERKTEAALWAAFERDRPQILGALLDAVSAAIKNLPTTHLDRHPRMADSALWVVAAEQALGWTAGTFMKAYTENREDAGRLVLEDSPVANAVIDLMEKRIEPWTGSATELLAVLVKGIDEARLKREGWPKKPNGLSNTLRRLAPNLRAAGIEIRWGDTGGHDHRRSITVQGISRERKGDPSSASSASGTSADTAREFAADDGADDVWAADDPRTAADGGSAARSSAWDAAHGNGDCHRGTHADDADDETRPQSATPFTSRGWWAREVGGEE